MNRKSIEDSCKKASCALFLMVSLFLRQHANAQNTMTLQWWNPVSNGFQVVEGQAWPKEVNGAYERLPARAEKVVNADVWKLSRQSAGIIVKFKTNAEQITIRYQVDGALAMPHMPATGVSGVDLYGIDASGNYLWCAGKYSFKDTITYSYINLKPAKSDNQTGIEYLLYLPLFNAVKWLEVGTSGACSFKPLPVSEKKPIVVYGTSITQGACASRPGMAWTAILSRKLNVPLINLGFSGTGRLEKEVINMVNEIDASVFILDCLPNLVSSGKNVFTDDDVYTRIINAVIQIRKKHPTTPIVLTDHFGYTDAGINPVKREKGLNINRINHQAYSALTKQGIRLISLLPMADLKQDMDTMVDGTHPTDLGMMRYAGAYERLLKKVLKKNND